MPSYLVWLWHRLMACFRREAYLYPRRVCLVAYRFQVEHMKLGALLGALPFVLWWDRYFVVADFYLVPRIETWVVLVVLGVVLTHYGCYLGGYAWADLGGEERYREIAIGMSINGNFFPTDTMEDHNGYSPSRTLDPVVNARLIAVFWANAYKPIRDQGPMDDPGPGRYDQAAASNWAVRLHYRLVERGWLPWHGEQPPDGVEFDSTLVIDRRPT